MEEVNNEEEILLGNQTINYIDDVLERISGNFNIYVKDLRRNKVFYEHKSSEIIDCKKIASLAVLFGAMNAILDKKIKLKDNVNYKNKNDNDNVLTYIVERANDSYKVQELLEAMCIANDRNALNSLIDFIGEEQINKFLDSYGFSKRYGNKYQDSIENMAKLLELAYKRRFLTPRLCDFGISLMQRNRDGNTITRQILDDVVVAQLSGEDEIGVTSAGVINLDHTEFLVIINANNTKNTLVARRLIGLISRALYDEFNNNNTIGE